MKHRLDFTVIGKDRNDIERQAAEVIAKYEPRPGALAGYVSFDVDGVSLDVSSPAGPASLLSHFKARVVVDL